MTDTDSKIKKLIREISVQVEANKISERNKRKSLEAKVDELLKAVSRGAKELSQESVDKLVEAIQKIKVPPPQVNVSPPQVNVSVPDIKVPTVHVPEIKVPQTKVEVPSEISVRKPSWIDVLSNRNLEEKIDLIISALSGFSLPRDADDPVSVRLSDGEKFYRALGGVTKQIASSGFMKHGKTPKFKTGSANATFTIVDAVEGKKIKVYSLSLFTSSDVAVTIQFKDGAGGSAVATYPMRAITDTLFGLTENLSIPSILFETTAGNLLQMDFSGAVTVIYNLRYWDDDSS